jgi:O-antigen ligase
MRKIGALCAAGLIFIRFSAIHETIANIIGINIYLLYVLALPAAVAWFISGGFRRTFPPRSPMVFWAAFTAWMLVSTPFSFWIGGSAGVVLTYLRTVLPLALLVAGLPLTWEECRRVAYGIAAAAPVIIVTARLFGSELQGASGRIATDMRGTISNANDIAGMLLVTLPFVLFIVIRPGTRAWIRIAGGLVIIAGLYTLLGTASRGALVGLAATILIILVRSTTRGRIALLIAGGMGLFILFAVLPDRTVERLFSFGNATDNVSAEAAMSQESRKYVLRRSIEFTVTHPVFGLGPGNFMYYDDTDNREKGLGKGSWHVPHIAYTQISAECGVPALIFYMIAIVTTFRGVGRVHKLCRRHPELKDLSDLAFCFVVALFGFCVTILFLPFGYHAYLPMLGGFSVCLTAVARRELKIRGLWPERAMIRNPAVALAAAGRDGILSTPAYPARPART